MDEALFGGTAAKREEGRDMAGAAAAATAAPEEFARPFRSAGVPCASNAFGSVFRSSDSGLVERRSSEATSTSSGGAVGGGAEGTTLRRLGFMSAFGRSVRSALRSSSPKADEMGGVSKSAFESRPARRSSGAGAVRRVEGALTGDALVT